MVQNHKPSRRLGAMIRFPGDFSATKRRRPLLLSMCYFHSQSWERLFPWPSTSYSKIAATLFSRNHFGDELW